MKNNVKTTWRGPAAIAIVPMLTTHRGRYADILEGSMVVNSNADHERNGARLGGCTGRGFLPGQSGNLAGRPKGSGLTDRLRRLLEQDDGAAAEKIAQAIVEAALRGDFRFVKMVLDRVDGPVKQRHQIETHQPEIEVSDADVLRVANGMAARLNSA